MTQGSSQGSCLKKNKGKRGITLFIQWIYVQLPTRDLLLPFLSSVCNKVIHRHTGPFWKLKSVFNVTNDCAEENYDIILNSHKQKRM